MAGLVPELIERFRRDVEALTGTPPTPVRMLGLAVSGGPDSIAMLLLAAAAWPGAVRAATVNHGLRPEAADEALVVGRLCARLGVPHAILAVPAGFDFRGNLQERAREARYLALAHWAGIDRSDGMHTPWVAVAHHCNDVAETFLQRTRRGAGVGGLAEMPRSRALVGLGATDAILIRPLLEWSRAELGRIVAEAGVQTVDDPSNAQPRFDRSRIRALLAATDELPPARLAAAARNLRHAEDAIDWMVERLARERCRFENLETAVVEPADLPYELRRRLALFAVHAIRGGAGIAGIWRGTGIDRLVATLDAGRGGTIAGVQARAARGKWRFTPAPARRSH